jgi:hypothetical protein
MNGAAVIAEILKREGTEFLACYPRTSLIESCAVLDMHGVGRAGLAGEVAGPTARNTLLRSRISSLTASATGVAHAPDECVSIAELAAAVPLLTRFAAATS